MSVKYTATVHDMLCCSKCNKRVSKEKYWIVVYDFDDWYFCSYDCSEKWTIKHSGEDEDVSIYRFKNGERKRVWYNA